MRSQKSKGKTQKAKGGLATFAFSLLPLLFRGDHANDCN